MAKARTAWACQECGHKESKWLGRCPDCGGWSTLVEEIVEREDAGKRPAWGAGGNGGKPVRLVDVSFESEEARRGFPGRQGAS